LEDIEAAAGRAGITSSPIVVGAKIAKEKKEPYAFSKGMFDELCIYDNALDKQQIKQLGDYNKIIGKKFMDEYRRLGTYPIQAHRGGGCEAPEHTLETYRQTWDRHIVPEADVRTTSDDVIVCFHDTDLKRICPNMPPDITEKGIGQMMLEEVKKLDVGAFRSKSGQKVPTLDEVFKEMSGRPERFIYLDYKYIDMRRLAEIVKKYGIEKQVIFTNKSHNLIMQWKRLVPQSQTLLWMGGSQQVIAKKLESLRMENYQGITMIQFHYLKTNEGYNLSDDFLLKAKKEFDQYGIIFQILPWKRNDSAVFEKLIDLGIKSFATDYPSAVLPVYERKIVKGL
jgi:glycerophosphoryl diester phosphodiesterase